MDQRHKEPLTVTGFVTIDEYNNEEYSEKLREIRVDIRSQSECNAKFAVDSETDSLDKEAIYKAFDLQRLFTSQVLCATVPLNQRTGTCR